MNDIALNIVIIGLSVTSSWGNGHATTYRGLILELKKKGTSRYLLRKGCAMVCF